MKVMIVFDEMDKEVVLANTFMSAQYKYDHDGKLRGWYYSKQYLLEDLADLKKAGVLKGNYTIEKGWIYLFG